LSCLCTWDYPLVLQHRNISNAHFDLFAGIPGVLFVLPDSYVDPEHKDYGGRCFPSITTDFLQGISSFCHIYGIRRCSI
jgi:hypothetical protein